MESITIRNLDEASATWIKEEAKKRGTSTDQVILDLVHQGIKRVQLDTYHDLDALAGTWSDAEADDFVWAIADLERVDQELWH